MGPDAEEGHSIGDPVLLGYFQHVDPGKAKVGRLKISEPKSSATCRGEGHSQHDAEGRRGADQAGDGGGSYGLRGSVYPEIILMPWAARRVGRPVKWVQTRNEAHISDDDARDNTVDAALALDQDGKFLAVKIRSFGNLGAFVSFRGAMPPVVNIGTVCGVYLTPALEGQVLTGSFMDYPMPRAEDFCNVVIEDNPVPTPTNHGALRRSTPSSSRLGGSTLAGRPPTMTKTANQNARRSTSPPSSHGRRMPI
jgi:hypothetical protein